MERVELHCHSKFSKMDGLAHPADIVRFTREEGMSAVAITDNGSVSAFPEFARAALGCEYDVKPIFGIEAYIVDDYEKAVYNYNGQDMAIFIAVDVETTGFSATEDEIIEIGAVKICDGEVVDRFHTLVNSDKDIPNYIEKLTGISNEMVSDAPNIKAVMKEFCTFAGDTVLVAHNAKFDIRFLQAGAEQAGIYYCPAYIDTVMLCRYVYPEFPNYKLDTVCAELSIETGCSHRAMDDATACGMIFNRIIDRLKAESIDIEDANDRIEHCPKAFAKSTIYNCTVLLKNAKGKKMLYRMISQAEKRKDKKGRAVFSLRELCNHRKDFLLGSGCEAGLLYRAVISDKSDEEIEKIARYFDFIEVQPHLNNKFLIETERYPHIQVEQDLIDINLKLIALGEKLGIPIVVTGDVHYLNREDLPSRNVLMAYGGFAEDDDTDLHFRTTKEMLEAFSYLPEEKAEEIVVTNTNIIANLCEVIHFLPEGKHYPCTENDASELKRLCESKLRQIYKNSVSGKIKERLNWELEAIHNTHTEFAFLSLYHLIENLHIRPFDMNTRGCAGNVLVCFLLGISDINPIQYHLSPYFVFGFNRMKEADIVINFSKIMKEKIIAEYRNCNAPFVAFWASMDDCTSAEAAYAAVENYQTDKSIHFSDDEKDRIVGNLQGLYRAKEVYSSGMILIPKGYDPEDFTPIAVAEDGRIITYFNYYAMDNCLYKQDILDCCYLDMLERLEIITGEIPEELTYCEPEIMELFLDINGIWGCEELPEFKLEFQRGGGEQTSMEILKKAMPKNFDELVKVYGLCHGTNVWEHNAEILLKTGTVSLHEIISSRDDIYDYLQNKGIEEETAFLVAEAVRKGIWGRGYSKKHSEYVEMMLDAGVPIWFLWSCSQIDYLFPRAHAISYTRLNWRLGWYKVHYPEQYAKVAAEMMAENA